MCNLTGISIFSDFKSELFRVARFPIERPWVRGRQPVRFVRFDSESMDRELPVLEAVRGLDPWRSPKWIAGSGECSWKIILALFPKRFITT